MTPEVSAAHFAKLRATLQCAGLLDELGRITDPRRVLNSDECPNPWRGTGHRGRVVGEVGKPCVKLVSAAREHTTLDVLVGMDGHLYDAHLIFKGEYIQRQMIPDRSKLPNSKVSATAKGYQTGTTLLETLKFWDKAIVARGIPKPLVWTTDGHASRLNTDVLRWCRENDWIMYISPPHTTGIHQALDQIFKTWHDTFNGIVKRWSEENTGKELNKRVFTDMFAEAWTKWTAPDRIVAAFRRVGLSVKGPDPAAVPREKFVVSSSVAKPPPETPAPAPALMPPPATPAPTGPQTRSGGSGAATSTEPAPASSAIGFDCEWQSPSPEAGAYAPDSKEYWKAKAKLTSAHAKELFQAGKKMHEKPLTLKESHPAWQVRRATHDETDPAHGKKRIKGTWGDMDSNQMLERFEEQEGEEEAAREAIAERKQQAAERKQEKEAAEAQQREARDATRELERPVTDLLQSLGFAATQNDTISAPELTTFARANRAELVALGCDLASLTRKTLMPQLLQQSIATSTTVTWKRAPPKALPAPPAASPAGAQLFTVDGTVTDEPTAQLAEPAGDDSAAEAQAKRPRTADAAPAQ
eukprot:7377993-Prymnesium_polylepis.1